MWKGQSYWFFAPFFSFWCGKNGHEKNCTFFCGFWAHNVQWEKGVYSLSRDRPNDICSEKRQYKEIERLAAPIDNHHCEEDGGGEVNDS